MDKSPAASYGLAIAEATGLRPGSVYTILKRLEFRGRAAARGEALASMRRWLVSSADPVDGTVA